MFVLRPLTANNFDHFLELLRSRGEAPQDYYRWKYLEQPYPGRIPGFMAYKGEVPKGCIGIINRDLMESNRRQPVTWFADWFVHESVRGAGLGRRLMEAVRGLADVGLGTPGPPSAQVVCQMAGYRPLDTFYEYAVYLDPYRCGFARFGGSKGRKLLRGLQGLIKHRTPPVLRGRTDVKFTLGAEFSEDSSGFMETLNGPHLLRDHPWFNWICSMPHAPERNRQWWSIKSDGMLAFGFVEDDFWGLRKARLLDLTLESNRAGVEQALLEIISQLRLREIDWLSFDFGALPSSKYLHMRKRLPLFVSGSLASSIQHLSSLDKESSWREFRLY